jgi:prevent-host-death family protein
MGIKGEFNVINFLDFMGYATDNLTRQTRLEKRMHTWQLQEAKSRFSEVVELTLKEGPQMVTRRGQDAVVILSAQDYRRMSATPSLLKSLLNAPRGEALDIERPPEPIRSLAL